MFKKILFPLLLLATTQQIFSMEPIITEIDYEPLFLACKKGDLDLVKNIIENTANIDINQQDSEGRTPLLCAAYNENWNVIHYLLTRKADKTIQDNYGQSLFSKMVYSDLTYHSKFYQSLSLYTLDEINKECKTMPRRKRLFNFANNQVNPHITDVLNNRENIHAINRESNTALHLAFIYKEIPVIIELLKRGASLDTQNKWNETPYQATTVGSKHLPFVVRETFNNGPIKPAELLLHMFSDDQQAPLTKHLPTDLTNLIKNIYINHCLVSDQERGAEQAIWKPVCVRACKLAKINETDSTRCLTEIMTLSQYKKTEINLLLLKEGQ